MKFLMRFLVATLFTVQAVAAPAWFPEGIQTKGSSTIGEKSTAAASSVLDIRSTTKGMLPPRMTTAQRTAISTPATGLLVYDTNTLTVWQYNGSGWVEVGSGGSGGAQYNVITNYGFEATTFNEDWTASGGSLAAATGTNIIFGDASATWDASASSQTLSYASAAIGQGYKGNNCEGAIYIQTPSGTATHTVQVWDGTNVLGAVTVYSTTTPREFSTGAFPCPTSGNWQLRILANADEPLIALDDAYLGLARNVGTQDLTTEWGSVPWTPTGSWTGAVTYTGKWRRDGDTGQFAVKITLSGAPTGSGLTINLPSGLTIDTNKLPATVVANSETLQSNASILDSGTRIYDAAVIYSSTSSVGVNAKGQSVTNIDYSGSVTATSPMTFASGDTVDVYFEVPIVGWAASTTVMPDAQGWWAGANISGANPSLGTSAVSSYAEITNASLSMTAKTGSATAWIPCSSTNAATGTTCSAGSEGLGIVVNVPKTGVYRACAQFDHYVDAPAGAINVESTFQLVQTAINSQTILQEGGGKLYSSQINLSADQRSGKPINLCGTFTLSAGQTAIRLMYEQDVGGTPDSNLIHADASATYGQRDFDIIIFPLNGQQQAILANSVSTGTVNGLRTEIAQVGSTGTVTLESGDWINGSVAVASAVFTITLQPVFSTAPICKPTVYGETTNYNAVVTSTSTSTVVIRTFDTANAASASAFQLECTGPR